jgi:hypothetical protein
MSGLAIRVQSVRDPCIVTFFIHQRKIHLHDDGMMDGRCTMTQTSHLQSQITTRSVLHYSFIQSDDNDNDGDDCKAAAWTSLV